MTYPFNSEKLKREVYCPYCKVTEISNLPAPYHSCGHEMITVLYDFEGRRLTGELVIQSSVSTR